MPRYILKQSNKKDKKYMVITPENKAIYFGQSGASDYTINKDPKRKASYLARHRANENWNDLSTAGAWSRWLLWEEQTLGKAISNMEKKFDIHIVKAR